MFDLLEISSKAEKISKDFRYLSNKYPGEIMAYSFPGNCFKFSTKKETINKLSKRYANINTTNNSVSIDDLEKWDTLEIECFTDYVRKALEETL
jgi:hypothetical protein